MVKAALVKAALVLSRMRQARRKGSNDARKVVSRGRDCKPPFGKRPFDVLLLSGSDLDHQVARGSEQAGRVGRNRPIGRETVGAAVERVRRIMIAHLAGERRDVAAANVGRVRDDEVEPALQCGTVVAREEHRAVGEAVLFGIAPGNAQRIRREIGSDAMRAGEFRQQREQDRARADAKIGDAQRARARPTTMINERERQLDHGLGLRPRHQHGGRDDQRQPPEFLFADDAGDRLSAEASRRELLDPRCCR
jgi:hypothetical protein